jgi:subtilisin family serine protease
MKNCITILFVVIGTLFSQAQKVNKISLRLYNDIQAGKYNGQQVSLMVIGDLTEVKKLVVKHKGTYKYGYDNLASVSLPAEEVITFSTNKTIERIEGSSFAGHLLMDTARIRNNVDSIHAGFAPLVSGFKGRGVVVGIVDGGIYFQHGDFRKQDSTTRIRYIWDQSSLGANSPLPYNYGKQWNWYDIDIGNCTHVAPANDFGHGTCVAGIAAGNGLSVKDDPQFAGTLHGMAPESEIIAVRVKTDVNFENNVADAIDYIFKKADALGKPCVINTSVGTYYGSHDGQDLATRMIESLLDQRNGRVVVAAGGNGGSEAHHLGYIIPTDSAYTFFKYNTVNQEVYFDLWADTTDFKNAYFAVGANDTFGNSFGRIEYLNVLSNFNPAPNSGIIITRNLYQAGNLIGQINIQTSLEGSRYHVEFLINPTNPALLWKLQTSGQGKFDLWSSKNLIGSADMTSYLGGNIFIQYPEYRHPDTAKTIVSSWQCSDKVITVGNYSNRAGYIDRDGNYQDLTQFPYFETIGKRFATSSFGPTRDNRIKPDIMATGSTTICTGDANYINAAVTPANRLKVYASLKHVRNGGTSMAAPVVSGIAALYFEKRPTANYDEIKTTVICTAKKDAFTGNNPNNEYGNGKIDGFRALTAIGCVVFGATDTACVNYNVLANVDSGTCRLKVYGCLDSTAANYNPLANTSNGSCVFTGFEQLNQDNILVGIHPNPFSDAVTFSFSSKLPLNSTVTITNGIGILMDERPLPDNASVFYYSNNKLSSGLYFYAVKSGGKTLATGKMMVNQ